MFLKMVPEGTNIKFLKWKKAALAFSVVMMVASIGLFAALGLNIGIDFAGGTMIQVKTEAPADVGQFREIIGGLDLGDVSIQEFGSNRELLIRIESDADDKERQAAIARLVKDALNAQIQGLIFEREEFVGPKVSEELVRDGILAVLFAVGAVLIYIWFRFEWHFGVGAVIALAHDVILTVGFFAVTRLEFNLSIIDSYTQS
ncbi:MAG: protein translocase subunit SecF, partial [Sphingomonadales bacterium]